MSAFLNLEILLPNPPPLLQISVDFALRQEVQNRFSSSTSLFWILSSTSIFLLFSHIFSFQVNKTWIQAIEFRKREFDRLEKIQQSYQLISCLRKSNGRTKLRTFFGFFIRQKKKSFFQKHLKSARQTHFFQKTTKIFYLLVGFFNKFY